MSSTQSEIRSILREFIVGNFLLGKSAGDIKDGDSFLETGIVDSTGVLEIVGFLQSQWEIVVADEELLPENLDSLDLLTAFVQRKLAA
jgi:acyl carrier protein